ncbi:hypothetical protein C8R44DRAFT_885139 [Mycena epipterygia]|nr:hypothetical protein C8R44DRAFT_885139 [Mycena epipterygia]
MAAPSSCPSYHLASRKKSQVRSLFRPHPRQTISRPPFPHCGTIRRRNLQLHAPFSAVKADRAARQAHYDECHSLLSPIRRLPSEILVDIFARAFPLAVDAWSSSSLDIEIPRIAHTPLLALAQVYS